MSVASTVGLCLAGEGAIGSAHMQALGRIDGVRVVSLAGGDAADTAAFAARWGIPHWSLDLDECLRRPQVDAVLLATPSALHAAQAQRCLEQCKHVFVEIPMALNLADSERLAALARVSDRVCMIGHTRRFGPPHREMRRRIRDGSFRLQHLVVETYFFRRTNLNALGRPRTWTDHLLWHHACHSVDLAQWLLDDAELMCWGQQGPAHPELGIAMDMTIGMRSRDGVLISMALSFNNRGPFGGFYRYIGDEGTYRVYRDELRDHDDRVIELAGSGIEQQDREFIAAIREARRPESDIESCLPAMRLLAAIERSMQRV